MNTNTLNLLVSDFAREEIYSRMTNPELADELLTTVWSKMKFGTPDSAIICATIERLRGTTGENK